MTKKLIIVESPAKVKTIKKYLGTGYTVDASQGHVRDLPKSRLGIDVDHDFDVDYITIRGKGDLLAKLRKEAKAADKIYLATDPDREGEAISWHLVKALKLDGDQRVSRISFNEITKKAVTEAIKNPREINEDLVDAQQARRVLDRLVGYQISPILWAKVKRGLSAGRVQSVALRMICDREDEIAAFIPQEYWTIDAELTGEDKKTFKASFYGTSDGKKMTISDGQQAQRILDDIKGARPEIVEVTASERARKAPLPFTTSTLQQEAGKLLGYPTQKTMRLAQELYEGVDIKGRGTVALITYLRTDSTRISDDAQAAAREYIRTAYGEKYAAAGSAAAKKNGNIQDAHEAIRPTDVTLSPVMVKDSLGRDLYRLYQLIWKRFAASRMKPAVYETVSAKIDIAGYRFNAAGSKLIFDGFMSVYTSEDDDMSAHQLPASLAKGQHPKLGNVDRQQHFTQPPAHYTEASLVRALEENGIGRPSTYAPTITTILTRRYITREKKNLYVTELGQVVNNIMKEQFEDIVDVGFTAGMEARLDQVAEGQMEWKEVIRDFYPSFKLSLEKAEKELEHIKIADEESEEICPNCGRRMVIKYGPYGKFLACPGFPECRTIKPFLEKIGVSCPKCGQELVIKKSKKGRVFYGCSNTECDFISWDRPSGKTCPKCGQYMVIKGKNIVCSDKTCRYRESIQDNNDK